MIRLHETQVAGSTDRISQKIRKGTADTVELPYLRVANVQDGFFWIYPKSKLLLLNVHWFSILTTLR